MGHLTYPRIQKYFLLIDNTVGKLFLLYIHILRLHSCVIKNIGKRWSLVLIKGTVFIRIEELEAVVAWWHKCVSENATVVGSIPTQ